MKLVKTPSDDWYADQEAVLGAEYDLEFLFANRERMRNAKPWVQISPQRLDALRELAEHMNGLDVKAVHMFRKLS